MLGLMTVLAMAISVRADGATLLKKSELKNLIANAKTAAEHERIAQRFDAEAAQWEVEANTHAELALYYQRNPDPAAGRYSRSPRVIRGLRLTRHGPSDGRTREPSARSRSPRDGEGRKVSGSSRAPDYAIVPMPGRDSKVGLSAPVL